MHLTWRAGSPDSQFARWLMIVSMAMAVLPVCRSPMISSRWPRPIGVMASMALIPVCSGSLTFWRCTTDGACSSSSRSSVPSISPLPSSGTPSGSTTRPRNPSPTGTDNTSPVRRTCWPSSTLLKSPRMTTPISRRSRLSARPRIPPGNSSSSLAIAEGSPSTCAIPSPQSATVPTSCREASSGSYAWTNFARASRISSGRIVSSAMVLSFSSASARGTPASCGPVPSELGEPAAQRSVDELIPDLNRHSAHYPGIDDDIQLNAVAVDGPERPGEPLALAAAEFGGDPHDSDQALPPVRDQPREVRQVRLQATPPGVDHRLGDEPERGRRHLAREQPVEQCTLLVVRHPLVGQGGEQFGLAAGDPAEPEQLVLDVVQVARAARSGRRGKDAKLLG